MRMLCAHSLWHSCAPCNPAKPAHPASARAHNMRLGAWPPSAVALSVTVGELRWRVTLASTEMQLLPRVVTRLPAAARLPQRQTGGATDSCLQVPVAPTSTAAVHSTAVLLGLACRIRHPTRARPVAASPRQTGTCDASVASATRRVEVVALCVADLEGRAAQHHSTTHQQHAILLQPCSASWPRLFLLTEH
jgi:hypothetical protein